jgi:hypothetical protein
LDAKEEASGHGSVRAADFRPAPEGGIASLRDNFAWSQEGFQSMHTLMDAEGGSDAEEDGEASVKPLGMQRPSSFYVPTPARTYVEQGVDPATPVVESAPPPSLPVFAPEPEPLPPKPG